MPETREQRNERLKAEGRWKEFNNRRTQLRNEGYSGRGLTRLLDEEFGPRSPHTELLAEAKENPATADVANEQANGAAIEAVQKTPEVRLTRTGKWRQLIGKVDPRKKCSRTDMLEWVAAQIHSVEDIDVDDVPSRQALAMLIWAYASSTNEAEFMTKLWKGGTLEKEETDERFSDDGRPVINLIDRILQAHQDAILQTRTEGLPDELALPEEIGAVG